MSRDGVVLLDSAGQIAEMNSVAKRLLKCVNADLSGIDFWDAVLPDIAEPYQPAMARAIKRREEYSFVTQSQFEGDWLEYTFRPHPAGYVVNLKDVTSVRSLQLLLAESEFTNRLLFKSNPNAMWVLDVAFLHVIDVNQAAIDFYDIPKSNFLTLKLGRFSRTVRVRRCAARCAASPGRAS